MKKNGKSCGIDDIPTEFLKYGGESMIHALSNLLTYISDMETIPQVGEQCLIKPIHKPGQVNNIDNYRGITLTSNVYKLYTKIIENVIMNYIEENSVLHENQGAFRKSRRLEDNLFTLHGLCSTRKSEGKHTYLAFLDMSKAFDRVWRDGLFYLLWKFGVKGKIWRLICEMYKHVTNKVIFGGFQSDWYEQEYGVKQGCVFSPTLFNILMNELISELKKSNIGPQLIDQTLNSLLFADDIVLIADSESNLEKLLDITCNFAKKWNLKINQSKSKVMVIGKRLSDRVWKIGDLNLGN